MNNELNLKPKILHIIEINKFNKLRIYNFLNCKINYLIIIVLYSFHLSIFIRKKFLKINRIINLYLDSLTKIIIINMKLFLYLDIECSGYPYYLIALNIDKYSFKTVFIS